MKIATRINLDVAYTLIQRGWELGIPTLLQRGESKLIKTLLELWEMPKYHNLQNRRDEFIEHIEHVRSLHG